MNRPLTTAVLLSLALSPAALAQTATTTESTEQSSETETPPPPAYNGTASGSASGRSFSIQVVCEGFGTGGPVTLKSDPSGAAGEDVNGDGQMVDISASPDGTISLQLLSNNNLMRMSDSTATLTDNSLSYEIEMTFSGGVTENVSLTANCSP